MNTVPSMSVPDILILAVCCFMMALGLLAGKNK